MVILGDLVVIYLLWRRNILELSHDLLTPTTYGIVHQVSYISAPRGMALPQKYLTCHLLYDIWFHYRYRPTYFGSRLIKACCICFSHGDGYFHKRWPTHATHLLGTFLRCMSSYLHNSKETSKKEIKTSRTLPVTILRMYIQEYLCRVITRDHSTVIDNFKPVLTSVHVRFKHRFEITKVICTRIETGRGW